MTTSLRSLIVNTLAANYVRFIDDSSMLAWAKDRGYARDAEVTAECTDAQDWQGEWQSDSGAAWPCYTLAVSVNGQLVDDDVTGWHLVGPMGPDGKRRREEWDQENDDGACNGLPRYFCERRTEDKPVIKGGDNVGSTTELPTVSVDGKVLIYDEYQVNESLSDAADQADHGSEPTWEDADINDAEDHETRYIIRDYRIVEACTRKIEQWQTCSEWDGRRDVTTYYVTAWTHSETKDEIYETEEEALDALRELSATEKAYKTEENAAKALAQIVDEQLSQIDDLPDMQHDRDDDGLYVEPSDAEDENNRYHLDADETARVCMHGWYAILDEIVGALGRRNALAASRSWQEDMDRVIAEVDPWVMVSDSIASGNCPFGSRRFAADYAQAVKADGEIGAARASSILAVRDDQWTRRACRMAGQRAAEGVRS